MVRCTKVLSGVSVLRIVAAPDLAAGLAHPKVYPGITHGQAFLATSATRFDIPNLIGMGALSILAHDSPSTLFVRTQFTASIALN